MEYVILILALVGIVFSADFLVAGSVSIARRYKVSDFVIGVAMCASLAHSTGIINTKQMAIVGVVVGVVGIVLAYLMLVLIGF